MKPAPPVTSTRIGAVLRPGMHGLAPDRVVLEAEAAHALGLVDVAAVEDDRPPQHGAQPLEVQELELVPLGDQHHRVRARRPPRRATRSRSRRPAAASRALSMATGS